VELRRLHPDPAAVTAVEALAGLDLAGRAPEHRPYVVVNMVASADGRGALRGRSHGLGGPADRAHFHALRALPDAVLVGAGTARTERYGRLVPDAERREARRAGGRRPDPLAVVVSGRLDLPADLPLLREPAQEVVVLTASRERLADAQAPVTYLRAATTPFPLAPPLARLRAEHGVRLLLGEGGPRLNAALLREGLVDELFLTVAPTLVGDPLAPTIVGGSGLAEPTALELVWVLRAEGELLLRYRVADTAGTHAGEAAGAQNR